jgi:hypothetical protein
MSKYIEENLPDHSKRRKDTVMVQGRVPLHLVNKAKHIMKSRNLSWSEVLTVLLSDLINTVKVK